MQLTFLLPIVGQCQNETFFICGRSSLIQRTLCLLQDQLGIKRTCQETHTSQGENNKSTMYKIPNKIDKIKLSFFKWDNFFLYIYSWPERSSRSLPKNYNISLPRCLVPEVLKAPQEMSAPATPRLLEVYLVCFSIYWPNHYFSCLFHHFLRQQYLWLTHWGACFAKPVPGSQPVPSNTFASTVGAAISSYSGQLLWPLLSNSSWPAYSSLPW